MGSKSPAKMKIGELCAQSGVPIRTIRYYEDLGLIQSSTRTHGGFRLFSEEVLPRLAFIRRAQGLGFSLDEIKHILTIHDQGELPCDEVRTQIQTKVEQIDHQIHQLHLLKQQLLSLVAEAEIPAEQQQGIICPIIQPNQGANPKETEESAPFPHLDRVPFTRRDS